MTMFMSTPALDLHPAVASTRALPTAYWLLRIGAALCFIGHGAFGFITKAVWLPYFGIVGISQPVSWQLMPVVGATDVLAAMAVLLAPRALPLVYMTVWAAWTAMLRPLAGEPVWEAVERAGNYGVPLALIVLTGVPRSFRALLHKADAPRSDIPTLSRVQFTLRLTTCALLIGHGAIMLFGDSAGQSALYASIGIPVSAMSRIGWFEVVLGLAVLARPTVALLVFVATWKLATESLWMVAGHPSWEFVERAGSYAAPLALAAVTKMRR
jgi:hypothetical protein